MEVILFYFCGALMVISGAMMVLSRNAVVAACWLIFAFINAAGIYATLSAPFLAVLQVLVYAGAIMVLFLFVVMMLQGPVLAGERGRVRPWLWPFLLLPPLAILLTVAGFLRRGDNTSFPIAETAGFGSAEQVAGLLLSRYLLAFELISIVLIVAIIGSLALGKVDRRQPWK
jgi:NADH-quinone oxidoreductase subunit J